MKRYIAILISTAITLTCNFFPVSAENYTDTDKISEIYDADTTGTLNIFGSELTTDADFDEGSLLVTVKGDTSEVSLFSDDSEESPFSVSGISGVKKIGSFTDDEFSLFSADDEEVIYEFTLEEPGKENVLNMMEKLSAIPEVVHVEPNYIYTLSQTPNDKYYSSQYGLSKINAPAVWDLNIDCSDIVVAEIDTGVNMTHPDLKNNIWTNPNEIAGNGIDDDGNGYIDDVHGWDFYSSDNDPTDENGHGSHVAGIISASTNNSIGVASLARNAKIVPLKIFGAEQTTKTSYILEAVQYVKTMGFEIVNNSYGGSTYSVDIYKAIKSCTNSVFVTAAGNNGKNNDLNSVYPASYNTGNIIAVAATDSDDALADYSNYGKKSVDIAAPGTSIVSTYLINSSCIGYASMDGTSMACPMVTSAVAVMKARYPNMTPAQIIAKLESSADTVSSLSGKVKTSGRLNAYEALLIHAESVGLNAAEVSMKKGNTYTLTATVSPSDTTDTAVWTSSNTSVATVKNGVVTAKGYGSAVITVTYGSVSAKCTVNVPEPPTATVQYSTQNPTNSDVVASLTDITGYVDDTKYTYTFTKNGSYTFTITDKVGNTTNITATVDWIDKTAPTAQVSYSTKDFTNGEVTAKIVNVSEEIQEEQSDLSYTFTENGSHTFTITDKAGNTADITATVNWIDKTAPTARVSYSTEDFTNGDVTAQVVNISEEIQEEQSDLSYTFTENGSHTFTITDKAGNKTYITAAVSWIDNTAPTGVVKYSTIDRVSGSVVATLEVSENIKSIDMTHTFEENGEYIFEFEDLAGNKGSAVAKVDWIDKEPPSADVRYSVTQPTNQNVTVTLTPSENVTEDSVLSYTFEENGEYTFVLTDEAGNTSNITIKVDWIDKTPPTAEIKYSPDSRTTGSVIAVVVPSETVLETNLTHTFTENGEYTFTLTDIAGNENSVTATVDWIDDADISSNSDLNTDIFDADGKIEFERNGNDVSAKVIFEKTSPPPQFNLYIAYKENGILKNLEKVAVNDLTARFVISEEFSDCEVLVYVWDEDFEPLMDVQPLTSTAPSP